MGYCNGLVCIYQSETIYIINPTTRKLRILSPEFLRDCTDLPTVDLRTESFRYVLLPSWYINISESVNLWSLKDRLCLSDVLQCQYPSVDVWSLQQEDPSVKWEKIHSIKILSIDSLDVNFWKLGLAACSVRPVGEKPSKSGLEDVPDNHYRTRLFEENLVGFGLVS
ncbi:hypothetical protein ARALYDRAFT_920404 [Arabidopsis lyrata subsp. lyrata]|uniref:F-box associated domain-containing protein n=1 Tax=Arabidopsis lyrata subsp. lyrata TaxID=81972 RepID=D7MX05_ARALL|nr:hypothetical protein ARALYDRAFT_920404 [Arabidopsis lyrata subsp. lyrata]